MKVHETSCFFVGLEYKVGGGRSNRNRDESKANLGLLLFRAMPGLPRLEGAS